MGDKHMFSGALKARAAGLAVAVAIGGFAMAAPTSADAAVCVAAKVRANGVIVPGTRTAAERLRLSRACRAALRRCASQHGPRPGRCAVVSSRPRVN